MSAGGFQHTLSGLVFVIKLPFGAGSAWLTSTTGDVTQPTCRNSSSKGQPDDGGKEQKRRQWRKLSSRKTKKS